MSRSGEGFDGKEREVTWEIKLRMGDGRRTDERHGQDMRLRGEYKRKDEKKDNEKKIRKKEGRKTDGLSMKNRIDVDHVEKMKEWWCWCWWWWWW